AVRIVGGVWIAVACGGRGAPPSAPVASGEAEDARPAAMAIELRLSEGTPGLAASDRTTLAPATRLADAEGAAVWHGRPPPAVGASAAPAVLRPGPPPPRAGETIHAAFPAGTPAPGTPPRVAGELSVVRYAPEGKLPLVAELSVTFSEPMVAVTGHED